MPDIPHSQRHHTCQSRRSPDYHPPSLLSHICPNSRQIQVGNIVIIDTEWGLGNILMLRASLQLLSYL